MGPSRLRVSAPVFLALLAAVVAAASSSFNTEPRATDVLLTLNMWSGETEKTHSITDVKYIGEGGFGKVYSGMLNGKKVAVKVPLPGKGESIVLECDFFKHLTRGSSDENYKYIVHGIGPICAAVEADYVTKSEESDGVTPLPDIEIMEGQMNLETIPSRTEATTVKAKHIEEALLKKELVPVLLLEYANAGSLLELLDYGVHYTGQQVSLLMAQLQMFSRFRNSYDGLRVVMESLLHAIGYMSYGDIKADRLPIVHRDIKPENLMIDTSSGKAVLKVGDFGISFFASPTLPKFSAEANRFCGSSNYLPPETSYAHDREDGLVNPDTNNSLGLGYDGYADKTTKKSVRTLIIADPDHPTFTSAHDIFSSGLLMVYLLYYSFDLDIKKIVYPYGKDRFDRSDFPNTMALLINRLQGCVKGQKYYMANNEKNSFWTPLVAIFGENSKVIEVLKKMLACNMRERGSVDDLITLLGQSELSLQQCFDECKEQTGQEESCKEGKWIGDGTPSALCQQMVYVDFTVHSTIETVNSIEELADSASQGAKGSLETVAKKKFENYLGKFFEGSDAQQKISSDSDNSGDSHAIANSPAPVPVFNYATTDMREALGNAFCSACRCHSFRVGRKFVVKYDATCTDDMFACCSCPAVVTGKETVTTFNTDMYSTDAKCMNVLNSLEGSSGLESTTDSTSKMHSSSLGSHRHLPLESTTGSVIHHSIEESNDEDYSSVIFYPSGEDDEYSTFIHRDVSGSTDDILDESVSESNDKLMDVYKEYVSSALDKCMGDSTPEPIKALLHVYAENRNVNRFHVCNIIAHNVWTAYISNYYAKAYNKGFYFMDPTGKAQNADGCNESTLKDFYASNADLLALAGLLHDSGKVGNFDPILGKHECMIAGNDGIIKTSSVTVAGHPADSFLQCMGKSPMLVSKRAVEISPDLAKKYYKKSSQDKSTNSCLENFPTDEVYEFDFDAFFQEASISDDIRKEVCVLSGMHYSFGDVNKAAQGLLVSVDPKSYVNAAKKMGNADATKLFEESSEKFTVNKGDEEFKRRGDGFKLRLKGFMTLAGLDPENKDLLAKLGALSAIIGYADVAAAALRDPEEASAFLMKHGGLPLGLKECIVLRDPKEHADHSDSKCFSFQMRSDNSKDIFDYIGDGTAEGKPLVGTNAAESIFSKLDFAGICSGKGEGVLESEKGSTESEDVKNEAEVEAEGDDLHDMVVAENKLEAKRKKEKNYIGGDDLHDTVVAQESKKEKNYIGGDDLHDMVVAQDQSSGAENTIDEGDETGKSSLAHDYCHSDNDSEDKKLQDVVSQHKDGSRSCNSLPTYRRGRNYHLMQCECVQICSGKLVPAGKGKKRCMPVEG